MKTKKEKSFDAVKMVREIRDKHFELRKKNPALYEKKLEQARKELEDMMRMKKAS